LNLEAILYGANPKDKHPAKIIKQRFGDETIKKLLEITWWDWNIEKIAVNLQRFSVE